MSGDVIATVIVFAICLSIPVSWLVSDAREAPQCRRKALAANIDRLERELGLSDPPTPPRSPGGVG